MYESPAKFTGQRVLGGGEHPLDFVKPGDDDPLSRSSTDGHSSLENIFRVVAILVMSPIVGAMVGFGLAFGYKILGGDPAEVGFMPFLIGGTLLYLVVLLRSFKLSGERHEESRVQSGTILPPFRFGVCGSGRISNETSYALRVEDDHDYPGWKIALIANPNISDDPHIGGALALIRWKPTGDGETEVELIESCHDRAGIGSAKYYLRGYMSAETVDWFEKVFLSPMVSPRL